MAQIENFSEWQNVLNSSAYQELQLAAGAEDISTPARLADWGRRNGFKVVQKSNGEIVSFAQAANGAKNTQALEDIGSALNSNTTGTTAENIVNFTRPVNTKIEATETGAKITTEELKGVTKAGNSVAIKAIGTASAALTGVSVGTALGNLITKELYKVNPDFWGGVNPSTINFKDYFPGVIGDFYNLYFGVDENGNSQVYMQEDDFAAIALMLQQLGAFSAGSLTATIEDTTNLWLIGGEVKPRLPYHWFASPILSIYDGYWDYYGGMISNKVYFSPNSDNFFYGYHFLVSHPFTEKFITCTVSAYSDKPFSAHSDIIKDGVVKKQDTFQSSKVTVTHNGITEEFYRLYVSAGGYFHPDYNNFIYLNEDTMFWEGHSDEELFNVWYIYENGLKTVSSAIDGISFQDGANIPDLGGISITAPDAVAQALAALKQQIPELWNNSIEIPTPPEFYPNGVPVEKPQLVPVPLPQPDPGGVTDPITGPATQAKPQIDPDAPTVPQTIDRIFPNPPVDPDPENPTPPSGETGTGMVPPIILPTGAAHALFTVYNPTQAQINDFGAWLWSSDPIDALMKMFQSPIEAVISLHQIYVDPPVNDTQHIWCGYLDSGVNSLVVSKQYTTFDCGNVSLPEFFGNVFDYSPYTDISLYLPFIGIVPLADKDVMRSTINITYNVDIYTGACVANVKVNRDGGNGGVLYTFVGNCAVQYPLTSGNMNGLLLGMANTALSVASGNPLLISSAVTNSIVGGGCVQRSGQFSGNAGVLGNKTPYLIISKPQPHVAGNFSAYQGKPTNFTTTVGACKGFIKCAVDHLENIPATADELTEIDTLLQQGILA